MHPSCIARYAFAETSYWRPLAETAASAPVRDNLPEPGEEREDGADPAETLLLDIWREALGVPGLTAEDDFLRLGGNSMTAIRIIADIESRLGVSVSVAAFMRARTVGNLILEIADNM